MTTKIFTGIITIILLSFKLYSQDAETYSEMAEEKMNQKDYKYALVLIEKAISKNDTNVWLYLQKAEISFQLYGLQEAMLDIHSAIKINPKQTEIYNRAGYFYQSAAKPDSAILFYNKGIAIADKDSIKMHYLSGRATAKARFRDFSGAVEDFETVLNFYPNDITVLNNVASAYRELGMVDKGIASLKKIISLDSTFLGPYVNLGFTYTAIDSFETALSYFEKAIALDPKQAVTYNNRGHVYYKLGNYDKALADINHSISLYPANSYAYRNLALVYLSQKKNKEACTALEYADNYGFKKQYGNEVEELISKNCK